MWVIKILFCFVVYICINWMVYSKVMFIIIIIVVKKCIKVFLNVIDKIIVYILVI